MRELISSTLKKKHILPCVDHDKSRGGLSLTDISEQLVEAEGKYTRWGFDADTPTGPELYDSLMKSGEPLEWERIGAFQDVTMRLIAERIISVCKTDKLDAIVPAGAAPVDVDAPAGTAPAGASPAAGTEGPSVPYNRSNTFALPQRLQRRQGSLRRAEVAEWQPTRKRRSSTDKEKTDGKGRYYIQGEYANKDVALPPPNEANGKEFHVYVPPHVPGGEALMAEVAEKLSIKVRLTNDVAKLDQCHHFLLYLTGKTS